MKKITLKKAAVAAAAIIMSASIPAMVVSAASSTVYSSTFPYYSAVTGLYYSNYNQAVTASNGNSQHVYNGYYIANGSSLTSSAAFPYYSTYTNKYYASYDAALAASQGVVSRVISNGAAVTSSNGYSVARPYYSSYTGKYYATFEDAVIASLGRTSYVTKVNVDVSAAAGYSSGYPYYSKITGRYYASYTDALRASANKSSEIVYLGGSTNYYPTYASNYYYYTYPYYYDTIYGTPYYYNYGYYGYYPATTVVYNNNTSVPAGDGVPFLYGNNKVWGWTTLSNRVANASKGSLITIDMNGSSLVPSEILKAVKNKGVNLRLVLQNGAVWDINGANINTTEEGDFSVVYGTKTVPDSLTSIASKGAVSFAEITIGSPKKPIDLTANLTVKFSTKRSDCFAQVYLYDEETNALKLVNKSQVDNLGFLNFTVKSSGAYVVVLS